MHFVYFYNKCTKHVQKMVLRKSTIFAFYFCLQNRACLDIATYKTITALGDNVSFNAATLEANFNTAGTI